MSTGGYERRREKKSHNHLALGCTGTGPVSLDWMNLVWEDPFSHRSRGVKTGQKTLIDLRQRSPAAPREACHVALYMHLGLFTLILPAGWQARLTTGDGGRLCLATPWSKRVSRRGHHIAEGWHKERDAAAKDNRKTKTKKTRTPASIHHSPAAVQRSFYNLDLNY